MEFKPCIDTAFTSLMGVLDVAYSDLERVFGPPHRDSFPDGKSQAQWAVKFSDGTVAVIYDYRTGCEPSYNRKWHIGGFKPIAVTRVCETLAEFGVQFKEEQ